MKRTKERRANIYDAFVATKYMVRERKTNNGEAFTKSFHISSSGGNSHGMFRCRDYDFSGDLRERKQRKPCFGEDENDVKANMSDGRVEVK